MTDSTKEASAVQGLAKRLLPLNRKERYYTGTVLPMIVGCEEFRHLHRFLELVGLPGVSISPERAHEDLQLLTEYGFAESLVGEARERFPDPPEGKDTPDVVLCGPGWLVAVEAKMFDCPSPAELAAQLSRQKTLVEYWRARLGVQPERVRQVALLPAKLRVSLPESVTLLTWEGLLRAYCEVAPRYWLAVLEAALTNYENLRSRFTWLNPDADGEETGFALLNMRNESGRCPYRYLGRAGGLPKLREDVASGRWQTQRYQVTSKGRPNDNWVDIEELFKLLPHAG